jgi:hypothetical protein
VNGFLALFRVVLAFYRQVDRKCLFSAAGLLLCAVAQAQPIPLSLQESTLIRIDTNLGVALIRGPDGQYQTLRPGDITLDKAYRLVRLFRDRVELQPVSSARGAAARFWLVAEPATGAERSLPTQAVLNNRPDEGEAALRQRVETIVTPATAGRSR